LANDKNSASPASTRGDLSGAPEVTVASTGSAGGRRGQLKPPRMSEVVAGILRERIIDGRLGDGDLLPKQDELLEEFRISRPSMREALRILEDEGLLTVRRGNQGGSVIEVPSADTSAYTFGLVLQSRRGSIADLAEAIRHIEPITAALCARREDRDAGLPRTDGGLLRQRDDDSHGRGAGVALVGAGASLGTAGDVGRNVSG
jgi:DNA-binding transcriptional regulator YhcF (GntR family)